MSAPDLQPLAEPALGNPLIELETTISTNDALAMLARKGAAEGTAVVAQTQTCGRGRQHRPWHSPPGLGLYLSVLLRPPWPASESGVLALLAGVAAAAALTQLGVPGVTLKWPNDVLAGGKKICGVLVEPVLKGDHIEFAVVGLGINVRHRAQDFPPELLGTATSCALAGVDCTVEQVRAAVLSALGASYGRALRAGPASLYATWVAGKSA